MLFYTYERTTICLTSEDHSTHTHVHFMSPARVVYLPSLTGGRVSFNVGNDSPTLTGAKVTFTIDLEFPHNQKVQPNGEVVWAEDCIFNGNTPCNTLHTLLLLITMQLRWQCH